MQQLIERKKLQIVCVTESQLTSEILSPFIAIQHFTLLRNDVQGLVRKHGVRAYIHDDILVDCISFPASNVLMFRLLSFNIYIIIVYRPPSYNPLQNEELALMLEDLTTGKESIMVGDFNLPNIHWSSVAEPPAGSLSPSEARLLEAVNTVGLIQWVTEPTYPRSGNILDLLFTTEPDCIGNVEVLEPLPACDHCPVTFEYVCDGDGTGLNNDKDFELALFNASEAYDRFSKIVHDVTADCVLPKRKRRVFREPWQRNPPRRLARGRKEAWKSYKNLRAKNVRKSVQAKEAYSIFAELNKEIRSSRLYLSQDMSMI